MSPGIKELLAAAEAAVPRISPEEAQREVAERDALIVDVREAEELAQSGKVAGAIHVARGLLEFKADPESPMHDPAFRRDRTVIVYCAAGGRSALAGMAQVAARHWLAQDGDVPEQEAAAMISALAWRGLGSLPKLEA